MKPIIFNPKMVNAILRGDKTQTRRIMKPGHTLAKHCPYGAIGDQLWVRETWRTLADYDLIAPKNIPGNSPIQWRADMRTSHIDGVHFGRWRPSIYMPRSASRITLRVTGVCIGQLKSISEDDAIAEGVDRFRNPIEAFRILWDSINLKRGYGWESNPWVWVIEFRLVKSWLINQRWEDWQNE